MIMAKVLVNQGTNSQICFKSWTCRKLGLLLYLPMLVFLLTGAKPAQKSNEGGLLNSYRLAEPEQYQNVSNLPEALKENTDARRIELDDSVERELGGKEVHTYQITMTSGQFGRLIVDQQGIDIVVKTYDPDRNFVGKVDRPTSSRGREAISLVAEMTGNYTLQLQSLEKTSAPGRYTIKLVEMRAATALDESRIAAERAVTEGEDLRAEKSARSFLLAIEKFKQAVALWRALGDPYEEAIALYGIGLSCRSIGENENAVNYFAKAAPIMQRLGDRYGEAIAQTGLAWAYLYLGQNQKALENFSQALVLRRSINDRRGEALTLHGIGWVFALSGEYEKALENFSQALSIRQSVCDRQGEGLTLIGIGKVYNLIGKKKESLDKLGRALNLLRETADHYGEADALSIIGWVLISLGDYRQAMDNFSQALPLRRAAGDRAGEATTLFGISEAESLQGNLLNARNNMEASLDIIESLSTNVTNQELRISYFSSVQNYYEHYIDLLQHLDQLCPNKGYAEAAFDASERARARSLLSILSEIQAGIRQDVDRSLLEKERLLQQQLDVTADHQRRLRDGKHTEEQITEADKHLESLKSEYQQVEAQIRALSPRFAAVTRPRPLNVKEIQQQVLDDDTLLLEYALGEQRSYLWAVTSARVESFQLPGRQEVEAAARRVYDLMTARNRRRPNETVDQRQARVSQADSEYPAAAAALSQILLGPLAHRLRAKRLLIVAQGALQFIPFGALPKPPASPGTGKAIRPLVLDHEIVNIPSASTLAVLRRETAGRKPALKTLAVLADPVFSKDDDRVSLDSLSAGSRRGEQPAAPGGFEEPVALQSAAADDPDTTQRLPRLFATRWEAEQIMGLVTPAEGFQALDFGASRELAMSGSLAQYRIVHFATHAFINDAHPELSGVVLSLVDENGREQDGFLRAQDIFNLKLPAELVVLSGCRTGGGKDVKGEGLIGLTRGFMYAGAPRVVVSLWGLNDRATAELMVRFYRNVLGANARPPAAALRLAQLEMLKDKRWQAPYFWAAFILEGEWR